MTGSRARQAAQHKILEIRFHLDPQAQGMKKADDAIGFGKDSENCIAPHCRMEYRLPAPFGTGLSDDTGGVCPACMQQRASTRHHQKEPARAGMGVRRTTRTQLTFCWKPPGIPPLHSTLLQHFRGICLPAQQRPVAFVDVGVVPMNTERIVPHQTVVVERGGISAIGPVRSIHIPKGAQRIDGRSKFLMPGLADMYVHFKSLSCEC